MRRTRAIFSWVATSALTVVSAVGIVAMTTGNLAPTGTATASAPLAASASTAASAAAAPAHVTSYTVSYPGASNKTGE